MMSQTTDEPLDIAITQLLHCIPAAHEICNRTMRFNKPMPDTRSLLTSTLTPLPLPTTFQIERDASNGGLVVGVKEVLKASDAGNAKSSLSLKRTPDCGAVGKLMGSTTNRPFVPGGMEDEISAVLRLAQPDADIDKSGQIETFIDENNLLTTAPGMSRGVDFTVRDPAIGTADVPDVDNSDIFALMDLISGATDIADSNRNAADETAQETEDVVPAIPLTDVTDLHDRSVNEVLDTPVLSSATKGAGSSTQQRIKGENEFTFAERLDCTRDSAAYLEMQDRLVKKWPFTLDPFQQQAVLCLERNTSVFVAAHTSAGKTVVAEYAIALCKIHQTRVIYTSPIKALSNQKFREFKHTFEDVGLITGDIQLNREAFCLIMTTEILKSMLYNGSEIIRDLEWVIFDEVHYINDAERGHVWEEVLIMLPSHVKIIMLSATAPNSMEFADWVGRIKNRTICVVATTKRPVPLEHFLYTGKDGKTKNNRFLLLDKNSEFLGSGYTKALDATKDKKPLKNRQKFAGGGNRNDKNTYITLIGHLKEKECLPAVVFIFSRKRCDGNAAMLTSIDLTTQVEKRSIDLFFKKCISRLKGPDRQLPQVLQMHELCKRGIAVHHSGILPILKEVVELLFQQGFVKILFATETFAMGVNMPARTVVFDTMRKHDGTGLRNLMPSEYIQMAGRAGRRGLDTTGLVIILCKDDVVPESTELHAMMLGKPTKLESQFRITYGMLLNLLRVEQLRVEDMLQRSYVENVSLRNSMSRKDRLKCVETELKHFNHLDCDMCQEGNLEKYHSSLRTTLQMKRHMWDVLLKGGYLDKILGPGRLLLVSIGQTIRRTVGMLLKCSSTEDGSRYFTLLLPNFGGGNPAATNVTEEWERESTDLFDAAFLAPTHISVPEADQVQKCVVIENVGSDSLISISSKVLKTDAKAVLENWQERKQPRFRNSSPNRAFVMAERDLLTTIDNWLTERICPTLLFEKDIKIPADPTTLEMHVQLQRLTNALANDFTCIHCVSFREHFTAWRSYVRLQEERDRLKYLTSVESLQLIQDYREKLQVMKTMKYVDDANLVQLKGRVACEIKQMELLITELMLEGKLGEWSVEETLAVLSATTCQHRSQQLQLSPHMNDLRATTMALVERIDGIQRVCGVRGADAMVGEQLRFDLMQVVYDWAKGMPFAQIMPETDAQEGLIVRCIQRLDEVCRGVRDAARLVGDPALQLKMEQASTAIKRDIVFAASLYTID